jgi:tryptophan 7-halogenase
MSVARELPRQVAVIGDGQVGVLTAIALRRALPASEVLVIGLPRHPEAIADRAGAGLSFTNRLHDTLGVEEDDLIRRAGASHRLVVRYRGWAGPGRETVAPSGGAVDPALRSAFAREWGVDRRLEAGGAPAGSVAEALAAVGRFARPSGEPGAPLAELDYALRWNAAAYRDLLIASAHAMGVRYQRGAQISVRPDGQGGAAAVALTGAGEIAADFFVDCSGPRAEALSQLPSFRRVDWGAQLPVRALLHAERRPAVLSLEDRVSLTSAGWIEECAGRDGATRMLAAPGGLTEEALVSALGETPVNAFALSPGRAERSWLGNVIALGDAAATFEPLGWLNLDLAHRQLALLLELLPGREPNARERDEYNRRAALMADRARDVVAAHYFAPGAGLFTGVEPSAELALARDQFRRRGLIPFFEEMPLLAAEWSSMLLALGLPMSASQLAKAQDAQVEAQARAALAARCKAATHAAPEYPAWIQHVLTAG